MEANLQEHLPDGFDPARAASEEQLVTLRDKVRAATEDPEVTSAIGPGLAVVAAVVDEVLAWRRMSAAKMPAGLAPYFPSDFPDNDQS